MFGWYNFFSIAISRLDPCKQYITSSSKKSSIMLRKTSLGLNIASQEICRCSVSEHRTWSTSWSWFSLVSLRSISRFRSIILIAYNLLSSVLRHSFTCTLHIYRGQIIWFFRCPRILRSLQCFKGTKKKLSNSSVINLPNIYRLNIFNFFNPTSSFVLMCFCVLVAENARLTLP